MNKHNTICEVDLRVEFLMKRKPPGRERRIKFEILPVFYTQINTRNINNFHFFPFSFLFPVYGMLS